MTFSLRGSPRTASNLSWCAAGLFAALAIAAAWGWISSYRAPVAFRHDSSGLTGRNTSEPRRRSRQSPSLGIGTAYRMLPERWFRVNRLLLEDGRFCWDVESGAYPAAVAPKQAPGWWRQPITRRLPISWNYAIGPRVDGWQVLGFEIARVPRDGPTVGWGSLAYVPLSAPFLLFLFSSLYVARRAWVWRTRSRAGSCMACGYDLRGTPDCCPECGRPTGDGEATARKGRPRSRWSVAPAAVFAILLTFVGGVWAYSERRPILHSKIDLGPEADRRMSHNYSTNTDIVYVSRRFHREDWGVWKGRAYWLCLDTTARMKQGVDLRRLASPGSGLGVAHPDQWDYRIAGIDSGWSVLGFQLTRGGDEPFSHRPRRSSLFVPLWFPMVILGAGELIYLFRLRP